jgi:hypothetical protein
MAKKWAEVVKSEGYQKLPDAEKTAAQEQYFSQIVAPNVPEEDIGIAREQFFNHVSSFVPKQKTPTTFAPPVAEPPKNVGTAADSYGFMGEGIEPDAAFAKPRSVMTGVEQTTATPKTTPVKPEVLKAFESRYDAATPEQRKILEAQPNWMGDIARQRAEQMGKFDEARKRAPGKTLERVDPRVEARTQALIDKGEKPEFARVAAEEAAGVGVTPGREVDYMRYKGLAEPRPVDEAAAAEFEKAGLLKRGTAKAKASLMETVYGVNQFVGDTIGVDDFARTQGMAAAEQDKLRNSIGENPDYWKRQTENIIDSTAQNATILALAAMSGGTVALPMAGMFVQQFGQAYAESRRDGMDPSDASQRAAWMGMAEVLGEVPSFGAELKIMRGALKTAPLESLKKWVINTAKNDIPGEQLTTALQTFGDVKGVTPFGTKGAPGVEQYLQMMADTLVQTVGQSALMGGATAGVGKTAQLLTGRKPEQELPNIPPAEQLMREKGFLQGKPTKKDEAPLEPERTVGALDKRIEPTLTEITPEQKADLRQKRVEDIATRLVETNGLPAEDALKIAANRVQAEDKAELERQDKLQRGVDKRETLIKPADNRVEELTQDLIGAGVPPAEAAQRAIEMAQKEVEDDAIAEAEAKGAEYVGEPIATAGQPSVGVPSQTTTGLPPGGTTEAIPTGLGVAGTTVGEPTAGEAVQVDAAQGYELRKKTGVVGMSSMSKTIEAAAADTVADEKLGKVTNGAQAITQIIKTGNEFQKILARRIRSSVGNVKIVVVEANQPTPDIFLKNPRYEREWNRARAVYVEGDFDKKKVIYVRGASFGADQGVNNITMLHELLHAATNRKIMLAKQAIDNGQYGDKDLIGAFNELVEVMNNAGDRFNELADQNELPPHISNLARFGEIFDDPREFLAYGMTDPAMQEFLKTAYGQPSPVGYFNRFVDSVRNFFGMDVNDTNALADLINATDSLLTAREVGKLEPLAPQVLAQTKEDEEDGEEAVRTQKEIDKEVDINIEKIRLSRQAEELAREVSSLQALRDPNKIIPSMQQIWKSATYQERKILVTLPTTEFLTSWAGEQIPELKNINVLMEKMGGLTQQLLNSAAILAQTIHKAYKKDSTLQNKLEEIAYASTLTEIDPSDPNSKERNKKLDAMYIGLGSKGQQLYKLIKEHYENLSDYFSHLLDEQIINSNVSPEARDRLMAMVRTIYETGSKINPYFPLVRRGDYWLAIGSGKHRQFYTFETMGQRDSAAEGFAKERRTSLQELKEDQTFVLGNDIGSLRRASYDSSGLLKGMFDVIDSQDFTSPEAREELKDAVYQLYLNTMPEQSFRRQFINRKNITGFSTDLLRNISTTGVKMSTQLAKLKYSPLMRNSISAARDSIVGREELEPFVDEMQARINQMMNPEASGKLNAIGTFFNRASFIHYLSGVASALMQPVGVFQTGTNVLGARYGYGKATVELTKMLKVWDQYGVMRKNPDGSVSVVPPSIANASGFTADEKRAVREMLGRDVSQSTYASALFGYSSVPTMEFDSAWGKTKRGAAMLTGGLMHTTERLSREMMFMASYRLNRKAGKSHEQAVNAAVIDTNEALGNYGQYNRPIFMQKGIGKVLLQFTMYPLHVTLFLLRNFKRSLPLLNKEGKWEAAKMFYGTLGTTFLLAGASGLPLFSMVMGFLGSFWKDEDKPQELKDMDYETWWRNVWVPENLGHLEIGGVQLGDLVTKVVDRGAVNALTGLDIASRTSLNDLWLRDIKETKTIRESAIALAVEKAGPSANMVLAWADGIEAFMNGQYQKGIEKISPALLRNLEIANRLREEGAMDSKGAEIIAKGGFTTGELIGRAVGFNSDILSNHQKLAFKMQAFDQRVNNQRSKLLNNVGREYIELDNFGTDSARKKYLNRLDEVEKFNRRHPEYAIKPENIESSIEKRLKERGVTENWSGIRIDPEKATPQQKEAVINATKEIERRKRERE